MRVLRYFLVLLCLAVIALVIYWDVPNNEFTGLDDLPMIEENWDVLQNPSNVINAFKDDVYQKPGGSYYRPVQVISYMPDAIISGQLAPTPYPFLWGNILLFILLLWLQFWFLLEFNATPKVAVLIVGIYACLPVLTPAVAWIPGRIDIVLGILVILSIVSWKRYVLTQNKVALILHLLFFALALFNKESGVVLPVMAVLLSYFLELQKLNKDLSFITFPDFLNWLVNWMKSNKIIIGLWVIIVALWFFLRSLALTDNPFGIVQSLAMLFNAWQSYLILSANIIIPFQLGVFVQPTWPIIIFAIPGFALFCYACFKLLKRNNPLVGLGLLWFILFILPTTLAGILNFHRLLVPLIGISLALSTVSLERLKKPIHVILILAFCLVSLFVNLSFQEVFSTPLKFWENAVQKSPALNLSQSGLAREYLLLNELDSAQKYFNNSLQLAPQDENTRISLALIAERKGLVHQTDSLLTEELTVTQDSSFVYYYRGQILLERGDTAEAIPFLKLGYSTTKYQRNSRMYYDSLPAELKEKVIP